MAIAETYKVIPYDLSGAVSKNRFRQEILWGISKMFDLFDEPGKDFCVVFDYNCDVEVHFNDAIEFYQVKSRKAQSAYSLTALSKYAEKDGKIQNSIIAKLFLLKDASCDQVCIRCALVSNAFLKIGTKAYSEYEHLPFTSLDDKSQSVVKNALCSELSRAEVDLNNLHYIYTSMDLVSPENAIKGKITGSFEKIKGCGPVKPNALYRLIFDTVQEKACYEFAADDYNELVKQKGITKQQLDLMLVQYMEKTDNSVERVHTHIEQSEPLLKNRKKLKSALVKIVEAEYSSRALQDKEVEISRYLLQQEDSDGFPSEIDSLADNLLKRFGEQFPIEYSSTERFVFMLLIIKRWEDGKYEQARI